MVEKVKRWKKLGKCRGKRGQGVRKVTPRGQRLGEEKVKEKVEDLRRWRSVL